MKLSFPNCPKCGGPARGVLEVVQGITGLIPQEHGPGFDYDGGIALDWDTQKPVLDKSGLVTVFCNERHQWQAMRAPNSF